MIRTIAFIAAMLAMSGIAGAQGFPADILNTPIDGSVASWIIRTFGLLTVLSVAPGILIMVTSFPRFVIAFSILRTGIGLATTPSNMILVSLSLFMTFYVMSPTFDQAWQNGVNPLLQNQINEAEASTRIAEPFRTFMIAQHPRQGSATCSPISPASAARRSSATRSICVLVPAFMISEIRRGFEIGFLIVLPFLVIDLIVATITMAMGMMMLPPTSCRCRSRSFSSFSSTAGTCLSAASCDLSPSRPSGTRLTPKEALG
jgi:flagellar biosynthetic protein FliP